VAGESPTDFLTDGKGDRRSFFQSTIGRVAREIGRRAEARVIQERFLRPPGALSEIAFLAACTRCSDCITVCPVSAIVKAPPGAGLAAGTPHINPKLQACVACEDMPCAKACPTEALSVPEGGWSGYRMATLSLDPDRCIVFHGAECGVCARSCPIGEDAIALDSGGRPIIKPEGCVGCGTCVRACVTSPSSLTLDF
jgi:MauM/NapG family ferredoxin protein